jgi:hypothetical protein
MKITQIVALVSAIAFILTVVYVYGFSRSIEVNLLTYFSISDYIKFSVYWLPSYILSFGLGFCFVIAERRLSGSSSKDKNAQSYNRWAFTKFVLKYGNLIVVVLVVGIPSVIVILLDFFNAPKHILYGAYSVLGFCLWGPIYRYILIPNFIKIKEWARWKLDALLWAPIIIIGVHWYGLMAGQSELGKVDKYPTARLEMTSEASNKKGRVLLALSQYIVFLEQKTKTVDIIPVGQVKNIITIPKNKSKEKKNKK